MKRNISTLEGNLEVNFGEDFEKKVREAFQISNEEKIEDYHIKVFLYESLKSALNKFDHDYEI